MRPKSEIYTPKPEDEHPHPFICGVSPQAFIRIRSCFFVSWSLLQKLNLVPRAGVPWIELPVYFKTLSAFLDFALYIAKWMNYIV